MAKARWTAGAVKNTTTADGTFTSARQLLDGGQLAATIKFTITADRALRIDVIAEPGADGLTAFEAWSNV